MTCTSTQLTLLLAVHHLPLSGLFERAAGLEGYWQEALHSLKGHPHIVDIRNIGLMGAIELHPRPGASAMSVQSNRWQDVRVL